MTSARPTPAHGPAGRTAAFGLLAAALLALRPWLAGAAMPSRGRRPPSRASTARSSSAASSDNNGNLFATEPTDRRPACSA